MVRKSWRKFEQEALDSLKRKYPGYDWEEQKVSGTTGYKPDFYGQDEDDHRDRIIAECKYVKELTNANVDQVARYNYPFFPQEKIIVIPQNTVVSSDVREHADEKNVDIMRLRGKRKTFWDKIRDSL